MVWCVCCGRGGEATNKKLLSSLDPDDVGFVRWRAAFYVAGKTVEALHNLLYLLDQFFVFANADREVRVVTSLYPYLGVDIGDVWDELQPHTIDKRTHTYIFKPFANTLSP